MVDVSLLDFFGVEEFYAILKDKTKNNSEALLKVSLELATQLKGSRALLSLASSLSSNDSVTNVLDRLMDTAYLIMNAENVYLMQLDSDGIDMVITHSRTDTALGMKISLDDILTG